MKELVEVLAQALVDHPEEVVVTETETENEILLELKVASDDMGKVIGKAGPYCQGNPYCCKSGCL